MITVNPITPELLRDAMSYEAYRQLLIDEMAQGRTTGTDQSDWIVEYARMNLQRMKRLDKTTVLIEELRQKLDALQKPQLWVVLTEGWCGDAAQVVPVFAKIAAYTSKIGLKLLLRDQHPQVMDAYLTNGTRSIPKLIALEPEQLQPIGSWGPRPKAAQQLLEDFKANPNGRTQMDFAQTLHKWYADNKTLDIQQELLQCLQQWER